MKGQWMREHSHKCPEGSRMGSVGKGTLGYLFGTWLTDGLGMFGLHMKGRCVGHGRQTVFRTPELHCAVRMTFRPSEDGSHAERAGCVLKSCSEIVQNFSEVLSLS